MNGIEYNGFSYNEADVYNGLMNIPGNNYAVNQQLLAGKNAGLDQIQGMMNDK